MRRLPRCLTSSIPSASADGSGFSGIGVERDAIARPSDLDEEVVALARHFGVGR